MDNYVYVDASSIQLKGTLDRKIHFRSNISIVVCLAFGIAIFFVPSIIAKILGVFFVVMALAVLALVKDKPTIDIYDDGVLLHHPEDLSKAMFLPYEKIIEFEGKNENGAEAIQFVMDNGQSIYKDTFNTGNALRGIRKYIQQKETREIKKKEFEETVAAANPFKKWFNKK